MPLSSDANQSELRVTGNRQRQKTSRWKPPYCTKCRALRSFQSPKVKSSGKQCSWKRSCWQSRTTPKTERAMKTTGPNCGEKPGVSPGSRRMVSHSDQPLYNPFPISRFSLCVYSQQTIENPAAIYKKIFGLCIKKRPLSESRSTIRG